MFFYEWNPDMTNEELSRAIDETWKYIRGSGPTESNHHLMQAHLRDLIAEQARRARENK